MKTRSSLRQHVAAKPQVTRVDTARRARCALHKLDPLGGTAAGLANLAAQPFGLGLELGCQGLRRAKCHGLLVGQPDRLGRQALGGFELRCAPDEGGQWMPVKRW